MCGVQRLEGRGGYPCLTRGDNYVCITEESLCIYICDTSSSSAVQVLKNMHLYSYLFLYCLVCFITFSKLLSCVIVVGTMFVLYIPRASIVLHDQACSGEQRAPMFSWIWYCSAESPCIHHPLNSITHE